MSASSTTITDAGRTTLPAIDTIRTRYAGWSLPSYRRAFLSVYPSLNSSSAASTIRGACQTPALAGANSIGTLVPAVGGPHGRTGTSARNTIRWIATTPTSRSAFRRARARASSGIWIGPWACGAKNSPDSQRPPKNAKAATGSAIRIGRPQSPKSPVRSAARTASQTPRVGTAIWPSEARNMTASRE